MINFFNLLFGSPEKKLRAFTNGICKAMVFSSTTLETYYKGKGLSMKYHSDYAVQALISRPGWTEVDQNEFVYKNNKKLRIKNTYSVADVSLLVVLFELEEKAQNGGVQNESMEIILDEFLNLFKNYPRSNLKNLLKDWREALFINTSVVKGN